MTEPIIDPEVVKLEAERIAKEKADAQATENATEKGGKFIPKDRFDSVNEKRKAAEQALEEVANELTEDVPEDMRDLIPDLAPSEKVKWIRAAIKKGVFGKQSIEGIDTKRPGAKALQDLNGLDPHELRKMGYKN